MESVTHEIAIQCTNTDMNNSTFTTRTTIPMLFFTKFLQKTCYNSRKNAVGFEVVTNIPLILFFFNRHSWLEGIKLFITVISS